MTAGYYRKPEATAAITLPGGWLDSGDLAYRAEGEIFIAGRRKDLIIKAGRNLVPQEIEELAAAVPGIRTGCVVAFGVSRPELGTESLVVVAETRADGRRGRASAWRRRSPSAWRPRSACRPTWWRSSPPGAVPKTSSGKIRRAATRELYLAGTLGRRRAARRSR